MKNILVLVGSPRKNGNTQALAEHFIKGAEQVGSHAEKILLSDKKIMPCIDCKACYRNGGRCILKDDMNEIYEKMAAADIICFATPVYFYSCSAVMKAVIDRLHNPIRKTFKVKKAALLSVCADKGQYVFEPLIKMYQANLDYLGIENIGTVTADGFEEKATVSSEFLNKAMLLGASCE